jgi:hypothetical protein
MQRLGSPGTQGTTCQERSVRKVRNHLWTVSAQTRNDEGRTYKRSASKSPCVCKWGPSGRLSVDDADTTTPHQSEGPWSRTPKRCSHGGAHAKHYGFQLRVETEMCCGTHEG